MYSLPSAHLFLAENRGAYLAKKLERNVKQSDKAKMKDKNPEKRNSFIQGEEDILMLYDNISFLVYNCIIGSLQKVKDCEFLKKISNKSFRKLKLLAS